MEEKKKSRTSNEAKLKYNSKTYKQVGIKLRYDTDGELIQLITDYAQQNNCTIATATLELLRKATSK